MEVLMTTIRPQEPSPDAPTDPLLSPEWLACQVERTNTDLARFSRKTMHELWWIVFTLRVVAFLLLIETALLGAVLYFLGYLVGHMH
jgi:hypothetical protein